MLNSGTIFFLPPLDEEYKISNKERERKREKMREFVQQEKRTYNFMMEAIFIGFVMRLINFNLSTFSSQFHKTFKNLRF